MQLKASSMVFQLPQKSLQATSATFNRRKVTNACPVSRPGDINLTSTHTVRTYVIGYIVAAILKKIRSASAVFFKTPRLLKSRTSPSVIHADRRYTNLLMQQTLKHMHTKTKRMRFLKSRSKFCCFPPSPYFGNYSISHEI